MKAVDLTGRPDPDVSPRLFEVIADSAFVEESRLVNWNLAPEGRATLLFAVDGDPAKLRSALAEAPSVDRASVNAVGATRAFLLLTVRPSVTPLLPEVLRLLTRPGLVVVTPVVYRAGQIHARFVGDAGAVQAAIDGFPDAVSVTVEAVGSFDGTPAEPVGVLSDRQREAIAAALAIGYYDQPRRATQADVAAELDCAASTVAEHLQKAEGKLIRRAMGR